MPFCIVCFFCKLRCSRRQTHRGDRPLLQAIDIVTELEDARKFSLTSLATLLAVFSISGSSKALQPVVLTLLIYTISLRLATNTCFHHDYPMVSRFLHVVPLMGTSCTAGVALVSDSQSPVVATAGLLLGTLPLVTIAIRHGRSCGDTTTTELPVQMQDVPGRVLDLPGSANTAPAN